MVCPLQGEVLLQRLFSTFADGWPGIGLLFQRLLTAVAVIYCAIRLLAEVPQFLLIVPHIIGSVAGNPSGSMSV